VGARRYHPHCRSELVVGLSSELVLTELFLTELLPK
jgi:hypothetical protein